MLTKWKKLWGMVAVVLVLTPLMATAQPRPREARRDSGPERSRGPIQVINDWRDDVHLSMWTDQRERIGEWSIRPGEQVILQEGGERVRVRSNYKIKVGDDWGWVNVGQVGQFQNGVWYVTVRDVWQATHRDRPRDYDHRRSEVAPPPEEPRREASPMDQLLRKFRIE
jgi:hypothetical protein